MPSGYPAKRHLQGRTPAGSQPDVSARVCNETIGENLWRSPTFSDLPDHSGKFFPRANYALLVSPSGRTAYVLGGAQNLQYKNDIWKLRLSPAGVSWAFLSQQNSWSGRRCLAVCAAYESAAARPPDAIYVAGGYGARGLLADVWASTDGGLNWTCQCSEAPFGGRADCGFVAVRGHQDRLVLCGGDGHNEDGPELKSDVWLSEDAGVTWVQIPAPSWDARSLPLMFSFQPSEDTSSVLILGGKRSQIVWDRAAQSLCLPDVWQVDFDFIEKTRKWKQLGNLDASEIEPEVSRSLYLQSASFDCSNLEHPRVIKVHKGQIFTAPPCPPYPWRYCGVLSSEAGHSLPKVGTLMRISVAPGIPYACPRLFIFGDQGAAVSNVGALVWQRAFLQQVGKGLDFNLGLPWMVWAEYVMPALLPFSSMAASNKKLAGKERPSGK